MAELYVKKIGTMRRLVIIPKDVDEENDLRDFCAAGLVLSCRMRQDPGYEHEALEIKTVVT